MKIHNFKGLLLLTAIVAGGVAVAPSAQAETELPTVTVVGKRPSTISWDRLRELLNLPSWDSQNLGGEVQPGGGDTTTSDISLFITNNMLDGCNASPQARAEGVSTALSSSERVNPGSIPVGSTINVSYGVNAYGGRAVEQFRVTSVENNVVSVRAVSGSYSCN